MKLFDTHAHLADPAFKEGIDSVISEANKNDVEYMINVCCDIESIEIGFKTVYGKKNILMAIGLHPNYADKIKQDDIRYIKECLEKNPNIAAIGETGLDYYRDTSVKELQKELFRKHIELSLEFNLPIIIHNREAHKDILDIIKDYSISRGVIHCFSGTMEFVQTCLNRGFYISFAGNLTYPNAPGLRQVAKEIPNNRILIETDCPYLAPQAVRGKRNQPSFLKYTALELARVKGLDAEEVACHTTGNAKRLFGLINTGEENDR
ncbi:MAG: TatD family hydrolase [bacterium]